MDGIEFVREELSLVEFIRHSKHYYRAWYEWLEWVDQNKN